MAMFTAGIGSGSVTGASENTTTESLPVSSPASPAQYEPYVVWVAQTTSAMARNGLR